MSRSRNKWSFRRWRRRWKDRFAKLALRVRIWTDRHVISYETRRAWRRKWRRQSDKIGRGIESVGFRMIPHRPEAAPDTRWSRFQKKVQLFVDQRLYPVETRIQHGLALKALWREFSSPFRHASAWGRHWIDAFLLPVLSPAGFRKHVWNWKGLVVGVLVIAGLLAVPLWMLPALRSHNQEKWAAQARLLLSRGYYGLAYQNAARVLRANPENIAANRVVAEMQDRQGLSDAVAWRRRVVDGDDSASNQLALAATAIKFEPPPSATASRVLASIPRDATNSALFHDVMAQFDAKIGNLAEAESHYLAALSQNDDPELEFALAALRLRMRDPDKVAAAEQVLAGLATTQTNMTARVLRPLVLLAGSRGDYEKGLEYSAEILTGEAPTLDDRLVHLGLLFQKRDLERQSYLETLQTQVSANPVFVAQVAAWMIANGMAREAELWMQALPEPIQISDPVSVARADALVSLSDWKQLDRYLLERPWGTIEFVRQAMLAKANRGLANQRSAVAYFRRSKELASGMSLRLINLTRMVASWGWDAETDELLWEILDRYPNETWAANSLQRRYEDRKNTDGLRQVFDYQLRQSPHDAYLKNNLAMVMLLLRYDLRRAHQLALEAHQQAPNSAVNTSTYAFSLYVEGRVVEAKRIIDTIDKKTLRTPSIAAYYAIICHAVGDQQTALEYLPYAGQAKLLPEEKTLLDKVRAG